MVVCWKWKKKKKRKKNFGRKETKKKGLEMEEYIPVLPLEIIAMVLLEVDEKSVLNCRLVCHHWKSLLQYRWDNRTPNVRLKRQYIIGSPGAKDGQFHYVARMALNKEGNLFITDSMNSRVQVFDNKGQFIRKWGEKGNGGGRPGQFKMPNGIAANSQGNIIVTDEGGIHVFTPEGEFLRKYPLTGKRYSYPNGIAVDSHDNIFVAYNYDNVQIVTHEGIFLHNVGQSGHDDGHFHNPMGVAVDSQDKLYVTDFFQHRLQVFSSEGQFLWKWGEEGHGKGQLKFPADVAVDHQGNIFITDHDNDRIIVLSAEGQLIRIWENFARPYGITVDDKRNLFVSEWGSAHRILVLSY